MNQASLWHAINGANGQCEYCEGHHPSMMKSTMIDHKTLDDAGGVRYSFEVWPQRLWYCHGCDSKQVK